MCTNPGVVPLLEKNPHHIHWGWLSKNPSAIHILEKNPRLVYWNMLSSNTSIFEYDYKNMIRPFTEELMANRFHPSNIDKFEDWGFE
jgi:hypothetical protein